MLRIKPHPVPRTRLRRDRTQLFQPRQLRQQGNRFLGDLEGARPCNGLAGVQQHPGVA